MANPFTQLLAGLTGGFQGYSQQQTADEQRQRLNLQDTRQAANDRYLNEDRASQRALRDAQSAAAAQKGQQDAYLRTPEFQQLYQAARAGDEQAVARVASAVAGHPDAGTFMAPLVKQPKTQLMQTDQGVARIPLEGPAGLVQAPSGSVYGKPAPVAPPESDYQKQMVALYKDRLTQAAITAAAKAAKPTPDQIKSSTVNDLAGPAADALLAYHGGAGGFKQGAAAALSRVPLAGNYLEGKVDPNYQNAMNNARVLSTQYLEIMPKSRFQPSTVDDIMKQIAPNVGDSPQTKAAKIARVKTLKSAIAKRAMARPDAPTADLTDIPEPPGAGPP